MDLINHTPVPARLTVGDPLGAPFRAGLLTAKATFSFDGGRAILDTQRPFDLFMEDRLTPDGVLPRDDLPRRDPAFEVIVAGAAHASGEAPTARRRVALSVGAVRRELEITGDRSWCGEGPDARLSEPTPFSRMPLGCEHAFGGTTRVELDDGAFLDVADPRNAMGRGFDPRPQIVALTELFSPPPGYPRFSAERPLPNLEHPEALVRRWDDAPPPAFWGAVPISSGLQALRSVEVGAGEPAELPFGVQDGAFHRAHPDWVIALPAREAEVSLEGLVPGGARESFALPAIRVVFDYRVGDRAGTRALRPHALVLIPDQRRFYLMFRSAFTFEYTGEERTLRLRLEQGWYLPELEEG